MPPDSKRIKLTNGTGETGFSESRQRLAEELLVASREDATRARQLVAEGADAWFQDETGWTCLHHAAAVGETELVDFLLKHGAVWSMTDVTGATAGDIAFSRNDSATYDVILQEGIRAEMLKALLPPEDETQDSAGNLQTFLQTRLRFEGDPGEERCLDADGNGVMMAWEGDIMKRTAQLLCEGRSGLSVLNVGFGLGLVDTALQSYEPRKHLIIEAHPDVHAYMRQRGFYNRPNVEVFEGTWQQYLEQVVKGEREGQIFDAIYWDTFSEHYRDLRAFFEELPNLLRDEESRFSFFHGLGATSRLFYDVYTSVAEMHLRDIGLSTTWHEIDVEDGGEVTWQGISRRYWNIASSYRLPICKLDMP